VQRLLQAPVAEVLLVLLQLPAVQEA